MEDLIPCYWPDGDGLRPITTWAEYHTAWGLDRQIALTRIGWGRRALVVSTVHLISDHGWSGPGQRHAPVLWETLPFAETAHPDLDAIQDDDPGGRWTSRVEAEVGHRRVVERAVKALVRQGHTVVTRDLLAHGEGYCGDRHGRDTWRRRQFMAAVRALPDFAEEYTATLTWARSLEGATE